MNSNYSFPFSEFNQSGLDIQRQKKKATLLKEKWLERRNLLSLQQQKELDLEFKSTFETLRTFFHSASQSNNPEEVLEHINELIDKGASAGQLDNYELGDFNFADAVKSLIGLVKKEDLILAEKIITTTLLAYPDLVNQRAYAGNGGAPTIYWLCEYLSKGLGEAAFEIKTDVQYGVFFRIFCSVTTSQPEAQDSENYWLVYQQSLRPSSTIRSMQMEVLLRLIHFGYEKQNPLNYPLECFSCIPNLIKTENFYWIPVFFPYPDPRISQYILFLENCYSIADIGKILNGFKTTKAGRKFFLEYFGNKTHSLLSSIIKASPECISKLVQGNESELLQPFLKNYKKELSSIKDKKGNNLLHSAFLSGNPSEKIIARLVELGCSVNQKNNNGESPMDIAIRKKNNLVSLLTTKK